MNEQQNAALTAWNEAKVSLAAFIATEKELREKVIELFSHETNEMASGVENIDLGFDKWELKINHKLNYKLADTDAVNMALASIKNSVEGGNIIAERLVKWKPELSVSEYNLLNGQQRAAIDRVLTITPATKSIELKQRKK